MSQSILNMNEYEKMILRSSPEEAQEASNGWDDSGNMSFWRKDKEKVNYIFKKRIILEMVRWVTVVDDNVMIMVLMAMVTVMMAVTMTVTVIR